MGGDTEGWGGRAVQTEEVAFARVGNSSVIQEPMKFMEEDEAVTPVHSAVAPRAGLKSLA